MKKLNRIDRIMMMFGIVSALVSAWSEIERSGSWFWQFIVICWIGICWLKQTKIEMLEKEMEDSNKN